MSPSILVLVSSIFGLIGGCCGLLSLYRLRRNSKSASWRSMQELSSEVADQRSLLELVIKQQKRFAARSGGRPAAVEESTDQLKGDEWKNAMRRKLGVGVPTTLKEH